MNGMTPTNKLTPMEEAYLAVQEGMKTDKVDPKQAKKDFDDRDDKDIDNDGDVDSSDKFLHKRRKAIAKKDEDDVEENYTDKQDASYREPPVKNLKKLKQRRAAEKGKKRPDPLRNAKPMKFESVELDEAYVKSAGYKSAQNAIMLLSKQLKPGSNLEKSISRDADNVKSEFAQMKKHIDAIEDIWDEIDYTVIMDLLPANWK